MNYFAFLLIAAFSNICAMDLPEEFSINQRYLHLATTFEIETETEKLGSIEREIFSLLPEYYLKDASQNIVATARMHFFPYLARFDVTDNEQNLIGTVEQDLTFVYRNFSIFSPARKKLASAKMNFWNTQLTIKDGGDDHIIAVLSRPFLRFYNNNWTVKILDPLSIHPNRIHPHTFMTLIAFQVHYDCKKKADIIKTSLDVSIEIHKTLDPEESKLDDYRALFEEADPTQVDFDYIESLDISVETIEVLFDSNDLTIEQKKALWMMLEEKLTM